MKKKVLMALTGLLIVLAGCTGTSYSHLRNKEDKLIHNYLRRNHIHIIRSLPEDDVWEEKDYYKVPGYDDLYFHLHERGDSVYYDTIGSRVDTIDMTILINQTVVVRYKKFSLLADADTISYWTTNDVAHPFEFAYGNTSECESIGWHEAVRLMKYPGSTCELIVPSKQGFVDDETTVTPYVYIIQIKHVKQ